MRRLRKTDIAVAPRRKRLFIHLERLESRLALSGVHGAIVRPPLETISGRITNHANGRGLGSVVVQLIGSDGQVVARTRTGPRGNYQFRVRNDGPYVLHAVAPRGTVQTSPTFLSSAPTGSYATNPATGKPYTGADWNYRTGNNNPSNGPVGPAAWSTILSPGSGPFEAPINITGPPIDLSQYLTINYSAAPSGPPLSLPAVLINTGAQIQVRNRPDLSASIDLAGQSFQLTQFHFHDTAENQVDGYTYPMEEHFVNVSEDGAITAVAVFLQLGGHNATLQPILDAAEHASPNFSAFLTQINLAGLLPTSMEGWFFQGSLTTPPLAQPINWLVLATPITLDYQQLAQYEKVAGDSGFLPNNRPIQPTNGRQVNQFNIDLNFQGQSIGGNNFTFARARPSGGPNSFNATAAATPASVASPLAAQASGFGASMRTG